MAQSSGPIATGTDTERQLTDVMWRDMFGDEAGVVADYDGSAYSVTLPAGTDTAQIGSTTQLSIAKVAGFAHRIPANAPEPITIPVAVGSARTDIIALRYDPTFTGSPGPVRLTRIAGTSTAIPVYDDAPPGVEDLPLFAITRNPGQALSAATVKRIFPRIAPSLTIPVDAPLPLSSPLGTVVRQDQRSYRRDLNTSGVPIWAPSLEGSVQVATMSSRPTGTDRYVGLRVTPLNRPTLTYVWDGRIWVHSGLSSDTLTGVPDGAYVTEQRGSRVVNTNSNGDITFSLPWSFSADPVWTQINASDLAGNLIAVAPNVASVTSSTIAARAYTWNGPLASSGIRIAWAVVGYNT